MSYYLQVFIPIISLSLNVLVQVVTFRYIPNINLLKTVYLGFGFGLVSLFIYELHMFFYLSLPFEDYAAIFITNLIIYIFLGYCYFHFINLGETARRVRILRELYDSGKGLSMDEILSRYNAREIVKRRIDRLIDNGQVIFRDGRYFIGSPLMLLIARIISLMKILIIGKRSEFD